MQATPADLRARLDRALPRVGLARLPTPLEPAKRLGARLGLDLAVKREDESRLGLGGNKARQIEVILGRLMAEGATTVLTTAAAQSNFCRAMAAACARVGLGCMLLLRGDGSADAVGNLLLDRLFGAEIHWIDTTDPYDPAVLARLQELAAAAGAGARIVQLPGETGALAAAAAVGLAVELAEQWEVPPTALYLAIGSGLTAAGLALGLEALRLPTRVVAVSVQQPASFIEPLMRRRAREAAELLGLDPELGPERLVVEDGFIGPGYGLASQDSLNAVALAARSEALVLDPVYTGKAMAALMAHAASRRIEGSVTFVHTGGAPALFAHAAAMAAYLAEGR
jgi:1-aminocyclopropane-1-carboxylate deaminase/D-cysteine desulfhydrase-like pyridoxal-dependent ACC family enzyme